MTSRSTNTTAAGVGVGAHHLRQLPQDSRVLISRFLVGAVLVRRASRKARTHTLCQRRNRANTAKLPIEFGGDACACMRIYRNRTQQVHQSLVEVAINNWMHAHAPAPAGRSLTGSPVGFTWKPLRRPRQGNRLSTRRRRCRQQATTRAGDQELY